MYIQCTYKNSDNLNKNSLAMYKKVRGQSEARLQATKTSDIKEGQEDTTFYYLYFIGHFHNYD